MKPGEWVWLLLGVVLASAKRGGSPVTPGPSPGKQLILYRWSDEDMAAFAQAVRRTGVEPALALAVYASESRLNPAARNPYVGAAGIPQLLPRFMAAYGADPATFHTWSVAQQIPVIEKLIKGQVASLGSIPQTASKLYHLNFYPLTAKNDVVVTAQSDPLAYSMNKGFDKAGKGYIDESDLRAFLQPIVDSPDFALVLMQLQKVDPGSISGAGLAWW